jgi:hypothetical protein
MEPGMQSGNDFAYIGGDQINQSGAGSIGKVVGGNVHVDLNSLVDFATATATAIPVLPLEPQSKSDAAQISSEILQEANESKPDHGRLHALGRSLRNILESAAASTLSAGLLNMWKP